MSVYESTVTETLNQATVRLRLRIVQLAVDTATSMTTSWQDLARQKRDAIFAAIPAEWRVEKLPSVEEQVDVTEYIKQYLTEKEVQITQSSADVIAKSVAESKWTAEDVTRAFCHRAALAHQLVCFLSL